MFSVLNIIDCITLLLDLSFLAQISFLLLENLANVLRVSETFVLARAQELARSSESRGDAPQWPPPFWLQIGLPVSQLSEWLGSDVVLQQSVVPGENNQENLANSTPQPLNGSLSICNSNAHETPDRVAGPLSVDVTGTAARPVSMSATTAQHQLLLSVLNLSLTAPPVEKSMCKMVASGPCAPPSADLHLLWPVTRCLLDLYDSTRTLGALPAPPPTALPFLMRLSLVSNIEDGEHRTSEDGSSMAAVGGGAANVAATNLTAPRTSWLSTYLFAHAPALHIPFLFSRIPPAPICLPNEEEVYYDPVPATTPPSSSLLSATQQHSPEALEQRMELQSHLGVLSLQLLRLVVQLYEQRTAVLSALTVDFRIATATSSSPAPMPPIFTLLAHLDDRLGWALLSLHSLFRRHHPVLSHLLCDERGRSLISLRHMGFLAQPPPAFAPAASGWSVPWEPRMHEFVSMWLDDDTQQQAASLELQRNQFVAGTTSTQKLKQTQQHQEQMLQLIQRRESQRQLQNWSWLSLRSAWRPRSRVVASAAGDDADYQDDQTESTSLGSVANDVLPESTEQSAPFRALSSSATVSNGSDGAVSALTRSGSSNAAGGRNTPPPGSGLTAATATAAAITPSPGAPVVCPKCSKVNKPSTKFCAGCTTRIASASLSASVATTSSIGPAASSISSPPIARRLASRFASSTVHPSLRGTTAPDVAPVGQTAARVCLSNSAAIVEKSKASNQFWRDFLRPPGNAHAPSLGAFVSSCFAIDDSKLATGRAESDTAAVGSSGAAADVNTSVDGAPSFAHWVSVWAHEFARSPLWRFVIDQRLPALVRQTQAEQVQVTSALVAHYHACAELVRLKLYFFHTRVWY